MRRKLPVWLLGLANFPIGATGAVALLIAPQVLSSRHVPEAQIANITSLGLMSAFASFILAPILDIHFSRRTYALVLSSAAAILTFISVLSFSAVNVLGLWLFLALLAALLNSAAIGGWFGSVLSNEYDAPLGAWMSVANAGGFGVTSIAGIVLIHHTSQWLAATILGGFDFLPLFIILWVQPPSDERGRIRETFGKFAKELAQIARRPDVQRLFLLFALPCACFALTNTLGGLGADYHASEALIAAIAGFGVTLAGVFGSLIVPVLNKRAPLIMIYLGVGIVGGLSTLSLLVLPRVPAVYTFAFVTQNIWQAAAFATAIGLTLASIGKDNPVASTQYALLQTAVSAPLVYMQWLDGHAYGHRGLTGLYSTDGGLDLAASLAMGGFFLIWMRGARARARAASNESSGPDEAMANSP